MRIYRWELGVVRLLPLHGKELVEMIDATDQEPGWRWSFNIPPGLLSARKSGRIRLWMSEFLRLTCGRRWTERGMHALMFAQFDIFTVNSAFQ